MGKGQHFQNYRWNLLRINFVYNHHKQFISLECLLFLKKEVHIGIGNVIAAQSNASYPKV